MFLDGLNTHLPALSDTRVTIDRKARAIVLELHQTVFTPAEADELAYVIAVAAARLSATRDPK